jgi:TolA-binding protein
VNQIGVDEEDCLKSKYSKAQLSRRVKDSSVRTLVRLSLVGLSLGGLALGSGCAHQQPEQTQVQDQQQKMVAQLKSRLEEVERTNGRLNVRIEELEDQIFLLQDMTESNRIALRRRGYMQRGRYLNQPDGSAQARAQAPQPAPESYYGSASPYGNQQPIQNSRQAKPTRRNVTRIPLSREQSGAYASGEGDTRNQRPRDQVPSQAEQAAANGGEGEEVVITDEDFRRFAGTPARDSNSQSSSGSSRRKAQAPVTDEKLSTSDSDEKSDESADTKEPQPSKAVNVDKPLDLYKVALSDYRAGDYADALTGFRAFL